MAEQEKKGRREQAVRPMASNTLPDNEPGYSNQGIDISEYKNTEVLADSNANERHQRRARRVRRRRRSLRAEVTKSIRRGATHAPRPPLRDHWPVVHRR